MKLEIDLEDTWSYEESIATAIKQAVEQEVGKEIRKLVKATVEENQTAIKEVALLYAKRCIASAVKDLK